MTRTAQIVRGLGSQTIGQGLVLAVTFLLVPLALARLGKEDYGLWMVAYGALNYLVLSDFGLAATMARELAHRSGRGEPPDQLRSLIERTFHLVLWCTLAIALLGAAAFALVYPHIDPAWVPMRDPFGVMLLAFVLTFPLGVFGHAMIGLNDVGFYWMVKSLHQLVGSAVVATLLFLGGGLWAMAIGFVAGHMLLTLLFAARIRFRFPELFPRHLGSIRHPELRAQLVAGFWYTLNALGNVVLGGLDLLILGVLLDTQAVAVYTITIKLPQTFATQLSLFIWTLMPSLAEASTKESKAVLAQSVGLLFVWTAVLVGLVVVLVAGVNESFIAVWVPGQAVFGGHWLNAVFLVSMFLRQWQALSAQMLYSQGFNRLGPLTTFADGMLSAALMLAFVPWLGPVGVPLAGILGAILVSLPINLMALSRSFGETAGSLLVPLGKWFLRLLPVFPFCVLAAWVGRFAVTWVERLAVVLLGSAVLSGVYFAIMVPLLRGTPVWGNLTPLWNRWPFASRKVGDT